MSRVKIAPALALIGAMATGTALALPGGPGASAALASAPAPKPPLASAPAPKPPFVYAKYVSQVTASSATLKAAIDPRGTAAEYYFQYGPTTAYGSQTPPASAGSGTQSIQLAQTVTGLVPYTTYHFRVVATNAEGTTDSPDATFTTKKIPLSLAASVTPNPVVFGGRLDFSGTLSGTGNAGVQVVLQANSFPYTRGFHDITAPEPTDAAGDFSFRVAGLLESTQLRAATTGKPKIYSAVSTELVTVRVTLHVRPAKRRGYVRLYGTVTPSEPGVGVAFERLDDGRYVTVSGTRISIGTRAGEVSRFARTVRLRRRGLYRALVAVNGGAQVSGRSRPILIR